MGARGSILKKEIADKILAIFPGSFLYNDGKEIRINGTEEGSPLQIKITLTAAKVAVEGGSDIVMPGEKIITPTTAADSKGMWATAEGWEGTPQEPTEEEKERLTMLLNKLGL